jgi:hypothetical protein
MAVKRSKSRGRNLARTETQAGLQVSRYVSGERGRTNGREHIGAVSASRPRLQPQKSREYPRLTHYPLVAVTLDELIATMAG